MKPSELADCRKAWAKQAQKRGIDYERIGSEIMDAIGYGGQCDAAAAVDLRLHHTGQPEPSPEPSPEPTCVNCRGTKEAPLRQLAKDGSVLYECRLRFHGGDVFGWGLVVERTPATKAKAALREMVEGGKIRAALGLPRAIKPPIEIRVREEGGHELPEEYR